MTDRRPVAGLVTQLRSLGAVLGSISGRQKLGRHRNLWTSALVFSLAQLGCGVGADKEGTDSANVDSSGETPDDAASDSLPTDGDAGEKCKPVTIAGCGLDSDCDGIADTIEGRFAVGGPKDTDKDGIPDYLDDDSDGDGMLDKLEWHAAGCNVAPNDEDGDGTPDFQDTDSDDNGLPDKDEVCPPAAVLSKLAMAPCEGPTKPYDFDGDGIPDYRDFDNDHDSTNPDKSIGLSDKIELANNKGEYVGLIDTDKDGIPDVYDVDSDGDLIADLDEGTADIDGDGIPNFRDTDSDGDTVPDICEARGKSPDPADLLKPVVDTDKDGIADYLDVDSDDDLLADGLEDRNGNCIVDSNETDRLKPDTDGDGHSDLVEIALLDPAAALDPKRDPISAGKFYFIVPYAADGAKKPTPAATTLALATNFRKGDVAFLVDTTASMEEEIAALKDSLTKPVTGIIPKLASRFGEIAVGVAGHDDVPVSPFGQPGVGALPFYVPAKGTMSTDPTNAQSAANALSTRSGGDIPESQVLAMHRMLTGALINWGGGGLVADPAPGDSFGSMRFRNDALPILIAITDAGFHNGKRALKDAGGAISYDTTVQNPYSFTSPTVDDLVTEIAKRGAKFIGVGSDDGLKQTSLNAPYGFLSYLADKTESYVPKSAFGGLPAQCKTGPFGAPTEADGPGGTCRLVFSIGTNGSGLGDAIVSAVGTVLNALAFDVYVRSYKEPTDAIDAVDAFITKIEPQPFGGVDPVTRDVCATYPASALVDKYNGPKAFPGPGDILETVRGLNPGKLYCFSIVPKPNTTVKPTRVPQTFKAYLEVRADKTGGGFITLGKDREVLFIVPPTLN